jgi:AraC-like DNA-binding protein
VHSGETVGEKYAHRCICFDLELIWDEEIKKGLMSNTLLVKTHVKSENLYAKRMQEWIGWSCNAYEDGHPGWELKIIGWMSLLIGCLKEQGVFTSDINGKDEMKFAQKVMSYILNNYSSHITSNDAAQNLYMSTSYFCRVFKKAFGCSFSEYVLTFRLEKAKMLLCNTNDSVIEISLKTGFNSCSYFSKMYKSYFGVSPLTYRREQSSLNGK